MSTSHDEQSQFPRETHGWWQTRPLHERLPLPADVSLQAQTAAQSKQAERQLHRWKEAFGQEKDLYEQWLASTGLTEPALLYLLSEDSERLRERLPVRPAWADTFEATYTHHARAAWEQALSLDELLAAVPAKAALSDQQEAGALQIDIRLMLLLVEPLLLLGRSRLLAGIEALLSQQQEVAPTFDALALYSSLLTTLSEELLQMLSRTFILEFRIAQQQGQFAQEADWSAQFHAYARSLRNPAAALAFFREYPVLAEQMTLCVEQWCASHLEMLTRFYGDWPILRETFWGKSDPGALQTVQSSLGDRHQGGRSVCALHFASGLHLVYKPRSLAVDEHFQHLLQWLNDHGQQPPLRILHVLNRGDYGWTEWVETSGCATIREVERFYLRQGTYLALLYLLGAVDFHFENILAAGEHPVLVDLESLLHTQNELSSSTLNAAEQRASNTVASSVIGTLLLPYRSPTSEGEPPLDLSGLGATPGQIIPGRALRLSGFAEGELRYVRDKAILEGGKNRPTLQEQQVDIFQYLPQILAGFASTYRLLLSQRAELLDRKGPLTPFASDTVRVILRSTASYALLLRVCFHPYLLHDALDRERIMNHLWQMVSVRPSLRAVIAQEQDDLRQGNIPFFTTQVNSRDLWTSSGERIPDFFAFSGWDLLQSRLQRLNEQDLEKQIWFIRAAFASVVEEDQSWVQNTPTLARTTTEKLALTSGSNASALDCLTAAREVGDRLCQLAVGEEDSVTWVGLSQVEKEQWTLTVADSNLYNGLSGILLALAYLGAETGEVHYTHLAQATYATVRKRLAETSQQLTSPGFFAGWGGLIAVQAHLAALWQDEAVIRDAFQAVERLPPLIEQDQRLDLVGGSAGCIAGLLCLYTVAPSKHITTLLRQCGEHLAATAVPASSGKGWPSAQGAKPLTGFAHGAAGCAWALLKLSRHCDDPRFRDLALEALAYERNLYSPLYKNWQDTRSTREGQPPQYRIAWCYGAPGIGLARLDTLDLLDDEQVRLEIEAALETTMTSGFGGNHSLCHGDLGNLEVLYRAKQCLPDQRWRARYELVKATLLENSRQHGWRCGTPGGVETPGLMVGLAGICLQLLCLADPTRVPSILTMAPPIT